MRVDAQGNVYGISETNPGFIYRFVPDARGDLSSGQLYALEVVNPTGDRVGEAEWIPLDRTAVQVDANAAALAAGATGYNRPEDVEIATSTGNNRGGANVLYVALTGPSNPVDNRVIAIDLREPEGGSDHATAFVYDYVKWGVNAVQGDFEMPDNLALDRNGNLYITEDPATAPNDQTRRRHLGRDARQRARRTRPLRASFASPHSRTAARSQRASTSTWTAPAVRERAAPRRRPSTRPGDRPRRSADPRRTERMNSRWPDVRATAGPRPGYEVEVRRLGG